MPMGNRVLRAVSVFAALMALSSNASATLGGDAASIEADRAGAPVEQDTSSAAYTVYLIHFSESSLVQEYLSPEGTVFAVSWKGPAMPDLRGLLGSHFAEYTAAIQAGRANHHFLGVETPGLVVESSGHMRAFRGRAYLPDKLPPGVTAGEIR